MEAMSEANSPPRCDNKEAENSKATIKVTKSVAFYYIYMYFYYYHHVLAILKIMSVKKYPFSPGKNFFCH